MANDTKKVPSVPSWQQSTSQPAETKNVPSSNKDATTEPETPEDLLEVARQFLKEDTIRNASTDDKIQFLKDKGLRTDAIAKLLAETSGHDDELKTIHDTSEGRSEVQDDGKQDLQHSEVAVTESAPNVAREQVITSREPKQEMVPIITYPEFLLKPQKPPPLITVSRLVNAAYAVAGVSALTWAASKYVVEPMLQTLTEARHDFADTTLGDLEKMNEKLEGMVSHVPYIATAAVRRQQEQEEDVESVDSDPTELFHRDIATQTSPGLSRSSSDASLTRHTLDPTIAQAERLAGLSYSLRSLVQSLDHANDNEQHIQKTVKDFQQKLDTMESSYSLLKNEYYGSSSVYTSASNDAKKATNRDNEAQKFKQEIRALKGAFLSSRNFPSATRPTSTIPTGGYGPR